MAFIRTGGCIYRIVDVLYETTPTGMVPNEDTGTIMGAVTLPPGTSQERAMEVLAKVDSLVAAEPAVQSRTIILDIALLVVKDLLTVLSSSS